MASLWADYTFHETALSGLTVGAGARYVGSTVSYYKNDTSGKSELLQRRGLRVNGCHREI
jgi:outer membrane receptor protein involved in Fe transport